MDEWNCTICAYLKRNKCKKGLPMMAAPTDNVCIGGLSETTIEINEIANKARILIDDLPKIPTRKKANDKAEITCLDCKFQNFSKDNGHEHDRICNNINGPILEELNCVCLQFEDINKKINVKKAIKKANNEIEDIDPELFQEAITILREGHLIDYWLNIFHRDYIGNDHYARSLLFSILCGTCHNTAGLHPAADGKSGAGKSSAMQAATNLMPEKFLKKTGSPKALMYHEVLPASTVFLDDVGKISDDLMELIKRSTSAYQNGFEYLSVKNQDPIIIRLPARLNWMLTGVDVNNNDEQLLNRSVNISLDENDKNKREDHYNNIYLHQVNDAIDGRAALEFTDEVKICRTMLGFLLEQQPITVSIPWLKDEDGKLLITWIDQENPRNFLILLDLIKVSASIYRYQRKISKDGKLIAHPEDFDEAMKIWDKISHEQTTKLTKAEQYYLQVLNDMEAYNQPVDINEIALHANKSYNTIYDAFRGIPSKDKIGLLEKACNIISQEEQGQTQYDKEINDMGHEKKIGSISKKKILIRLNHKINNLEMYQSVISLRRDLILKKYESIIKDCDNYKDNSNFVSLYQAKNDTEQKSASVD